MTVEFERYELHEAPKYRFELERREFMRLFAVMGGGLLVIAASPGGAAQESGRGGQGRTMPADLSAWIHIDERGRVTAYTGKTEIGQNIRTSLAQVVADELRIPVDRVSFIMADTDLTPFDQGTFGSMTTPRMAPQIARAAAVARELLIDQAAAHLQADRASLSAKDGAIAAFGGRRVTFAELTKGQKLTGTVAPQTRVAPASEWDVRGTATKKVDGRSFVTGSHQYTPDVTRPGMVHGRVIRPDGYIGTLISIDDAAAKQMSGVTVVRDGDFAGVTAPTERAARRAAAAVRARWSVPPNLPTSESIYEHLKKAPDRPAEGRAAPRPFIVGDVAAAKAQAARTFQASYLVPYIAHVPLEPRAAVAEWSADGKLTVWCGTQRPFGVRSELASAFRIPEERVRVIVPDTGSAYGGKHSGEHAIEAARLAKGAGKPVKLVWTRAEEFAWGYLRPAGVIDASASVDNGGRLVAWEFDNWNSGASAIQTPYVIPNQRITFHPSNSPLRQGSYRGLAATANHYVREMHMDEVARALAIDPVEFRLNHLKEPRMRAVLEAVAERIGWTASAGTGAYGAGSRASAAPALGIACGTEKGSYVATATQVSRAASGFKVDKLVVAFECGAIVNPDGLRNQVEGAVVQGLGGALFEAIDFRDGKIVNGSMELYRVPRFKDVPPLEIILLDRKDLPSAGAGETPIVCVAPAIGSAVRGFGKVAAALPVKLA
jgi:isoquinoline 1-oxidoreductase